MKLIVVLAQAFPKNIESKIKLYNNQLFSHQEARKIIGGRWVRQKASGEWMQWSSSDDTWMRGEKIQREDWGRKRPVRKLIEHAKRWVIARGGEINMGEQRSIELKKKLDAARMAFALLRKAREILQDGPDDSDVDMASEMAEKAYQELKIALEETSHQGKLP